jgi:hypothetical protein
MNFQKFPDDIPVPRSVTLESRGELVGLIAAAVFLMTQRAFGGLPPLKLPTIIEGNVPFPPADTSALPNPVEALRYLNGEYLSGVHNQLQAYNRAIEDGRDIEAANVTDEAPGMAHVGWQYLCVLENAAAAAEGKSKSTTPSLPADLIEQYKRFQ